MNSMHALVLCAALSLPGAVLANDSVKAGGGDNSKFGRTVDDNSVKAGGGDNSKHGRTVEGDSVKSGRPKNKHGRTITN
jgi:hypothetical protein